MFTVIIRSTSHRTDESGDVRPWIGAWVRAIARPQNGTAEEVQHYADTINAWPPDARCNPKLGNFCNHYEARVVPMDDVAWGKQAPFATRARLVMAGVMRHINADTMTTAELEAAESDERATAMHYARTR